MALCGNMTYRGGTWWCYGMCSVCISVECVVLYHIRSGCMYGDVVCDGVWCRVE